MKISVLYILAHTENSWHESITKRYKGREEERMRKKKKEKNMSRLMDRAQTVCNIH